MASDDGRGDAGAPEGAENGNHSLLQSLEKEVLLLRKSRDEQEETTASLLAELQRRCDKVIELEVNLDQERARADRLARERTEEEEALSGELRDIMATVAVGSDVSGTPAAAAAAPASPAAGNDLPFDSESIERQQVANKTAVDKEPGHEPPEDGGGGGGGGGAVASASGIFSEWRMGRVRGGKARDDDREGNNAGTGSGKTGPASETMTAEEQEKRKDSANGPGGDGQKSSSNGGGGAREQAAGALRARVVELELQRAEAADEMREKTDRSIRLEVQVEQLKNIVQSLSHASSREETQAWGQGSSATSSTQGTVDLDPLLRDVPGVDPSVLLLLHRTPWADVVLEGIRKEESCFEWQGKDSRGAWSSRLGTLPTELSSLPLHHLAGPHAPPQPPPPPQALSSLPQSTTSPSSSSPSSSRSRSPTLALTGSVTADHARCEAGGQAGSDARVGGLRDKIGGAVAAVAAAGRGLGGGIGGAPGWRMVTDESVTFRFELDDVGLPSHHWEWVGGWMVDSETEASSDQDGWIYGRSTSEISEIALGRTSSHSNGMRSSSSSSPEISSGRSAADARARAAGVGDGTREPEARPENTQDGDESPPPQQHQQRQQQQQQQQQRLVTGNYSGSDIASSGDNKSKEDAKGPRRQATAATVGGDSDGAGGGWGLRRRRLVRLRMVRMVDGARDSTTSVLEMIRRLSSMEILVRKLSRQVVTQQRQMTALESQVAFLAPLQPKLRMACALGRKDRMRGDALQGKLIEAENELKVLRRCMDTTSGTGTGTGPRGPAAPPLAPATSRRAAAPAPLRAAVPGGRNDKVATEDDDGVSARRAGGDGGVHNRVAGAAGGGGAAAWGWVEGVAQRAAGTLVRRGRAAEPNDKGVGGEESGAVTFRPAGRGDAGTLV
ncbi:unnamed protein product [Ectocarpus sp. 12 AP-2014]